MLAMRFFIHDHVHVHVTTRPTTSSEAMRYGHSNDPATHHWSTGSLLDLFALISVRSRCALFLSRYSDGARLVVDNLLGRVAAYLLCQNSNPAF